MIEIIVQDYLLAALSVPVYIDVPANPPESYVVIQRTGGDEEDYVRSAMIAVQSYAGSRMGAATLHETVLELMKGMNVLDDIGACNLNAEYDYTDTSTKRHRYQAVFEIIYY